MSEVEYAVVAEQRSPGEVKTLRCARCKQQPVTAKRRLCPLCVVELRAPDPSERRAVGA
jgi:hypothetical protein